MVRFSSVPPVIGVSSRLSSFRRAVLPGTRHPLMSLSDVSPRLRTATDSLPPTLRSVFFVVGVGAVVVVVIVVW